jgi:hypothetical protein
MPTAQLLAILAEQGRVLQLIRDYRFRDAAATAFSLSEWFKQRSLQEFWAATYRLERLDRELFGSGNPIVREALVALYPQHDDIRKVALKGDLAKAAAMAKDMGRDDVTRMLREGMKAQLADMPTNMTEILKTLRECLNQVTDEAAADQLSAVITLLKDGDVFAARRTVSSVLESMNFPAIEFKRLASDLKSIEARIGRLVEVRGFLSSYRFQEALLVLATAPNDGEIALVVANAEERAEEGKRMAMQGALTLKSVGKKSALRAAFNQAAEHDYVMAYARAKAAGAEGETAMEKFGKARDLQAMALYRIDVKLKRLLTVNQLETGVVARFAELVETPAHRLALTTQLEGGFYKQALRTIENLKPIEVRLFHVLERLGAYEDRRRNPQPSALTTTLYQHVRFFYRALFAFHGISPDSSFEDALSDVNKGASLLEKSMELSAEHGRDLMQRMFAKRSQNRGRRLNEVDEGLTADRKAWIERLEKAMALDGTVKGMALMSNFQVGRKRNYAGYYQAANRRYLRWLTTESKDWSGTDRSGRKSKELPTPKP